jgi:hypothetical protein
MTLGRYMLFDADPGLINTDLPRLLEVRAEEIQDLAARLFDPAKVAVLEIVPSAQETEMAGAVAGETA